MRRLTTLVLFAAGISGLCSAQQGGGIAGTVATISGEPLKDVTLRLQANFSEGSPEAALTPRPRLYTVSSDAQGNFSFEAVEPGHYVLSSDKAGYLGGVYGDDSNGHVTIFAVRPGRPLTGIAIKMSLQGVISGTITNEQGSPLANVRVTAARWAYAGGRRTLVHTNSANSNGKGNFSIGNLHAGSYEVYATLFDSNGGPPAAEHTAEESYVTTYYPGTIDSSGAAAIRITAGTVVGSASIQLRKTRTYRVRGKVEGGPPQNGTVTLVSKDGPDGYASNQRVREANGSFEFSGVRPGAYLLFARPGSSVKPPGMGLQTVVVGAADVDGVVLPLGAGLDIAGIISIDGPVSRQNDTPYVRFSDPGQHLAFGASPMKADGSFEIRQLMPTAYQVDVMSLPAGTYVKSIRFGDQDVTRTLLDLASGSRGALTVVLSAKAGEIRGVVHGADSSPRSGGALTLWTPGVSSKAASGFTVTTTADVNGQFRFDSLPPGEYRVAAWEQIDHGLGTDPAFLSAFDGQATIVKLNESDHSQLELAEIPRAAIEAVMARLK